MDCLYWSQLKLVEDDELEDILKLADSIRENTDDVSDINPTLFDIQSFTPADHADVNQHIIAANEEAIDDKSLMKMLNECLPVIQPTETFTKEPDSSINEQLPTLQQLQLFESGWPFTDYQSFSYWSVLKEHTRGPSSFNYQDISSSPSASSSSSSASPLSQSAFDFDVEREASRQRGEAGLYLMSTPVRPKKPRRRSSCDGCSNASSSISSTARSRPCQGKRKRTGKTNKMKVYHLWEFIHELLEFSELQQQVCVPNGLPVVRWESKENGVFRIVDSKRLAMLWGQHKRNNSMTYEKLSRSLRWCRSSGFLSEVPKNANYPKKLCFRFGHRAAEMYAARRQSYQVQHQLIVY